MPRDQVAILSQFKIPRGRSAAERRLQAVAALHAPIPFIERGILRGDPDVQHLICGECRSGDSLRKHVAWPCATARLIGLMPGEDD